MQLFAEDLREFRVDSSLEERLQAEADWMLQVTTK